jgi:carotenoid cleavage dioxygenase-like enzyme
MSLVRGFGLTGASAPSCFVPAAPAAPEDDGYVIAFAHNPDRGAADVVILAADGQRGSHKPRLVTRRPHASSDVTTPSER